jgi:hypothetical protein
VHHCPGVAPRTGSAPEGAAKPTDSLGLPV